MRLRIAFSTLVVCLIAPGIGQAQSSVDSTQVNESTLHFKIESPTKQKMEYGVLVDGQPAESVKLYVRCEGRELDVFINGEFYGGDRRHVRWHFGDERWRAKYWTVGFNSLGGGIRVGEETERSFVERARSAEKLVVRVRDFEEEEHFYVFNLRAFREAVSNPMPCLNNAKSPG